MTEIQHEPLSGEEQLRLKEIENLDSQRERESAENTASLKAQARVTSVSVLAVTSVVLILSYGSILLTQLSKTVPPFFSTTVSVAITGLVGLLSFNAGKASTSKTKA